MSMNTELIAEAHKRARGLTAIAERGGDPWIRVDAAAARSTVHLLVNALEAAEAELTRSALPSPHTLDQCLCTVYSQDAGGGYFEPLLEQEPACPVHSEYVFDPKVAAWVHRNSLAAVPERTLTDADLDRFETTAEPIYRSTVEAAKASKFLVSTLAQWVMRLTAEVRRLSGAPVSLESEWEYGVTYVDPARPVSFSTSMDKAVESKAFYDGLIAANPSTYREQSPSMILRRTPGVAPGPWLPVSTEGDNRG